VLNAGPARRALSGEQLHPPHLIDSEVANGLRRRVAAAQLSAADGCGALKVWRSLGMTRHPVFALLDRVWELRDTLSAYEASYAALAELLDCSPLTADTRLSRAPGIRCAITVLPT